MFPMQESFHVPGSFNPPVLPAPDASFSESGGRRPAWVMLDEIAYIGDRKNGTFAQAITRTGQAVGVSFWLAAPPAVSHLCIHCSGMKATDMMDEPVVVCSGEDIAVIRVVYNTGARVLPLQCVEDIGVADCDYLIYRSHTNPPTLDVLPNPKPYVFHPWEIGFFTSQDSKDFFMAALRPGDALLQYDLHIFSSKTNTWTAKLALLEPPSPRCMDEGLVHETDKVITLQGGLLGWVDLWHGILLCNVLDTNPTVQYIQLPKPLDGNLWLQYLEAPARAVRDVTCSDGSIKLIEIEDQQGLVATARTSSGPKNRAAMIDSGLEVERNCTTEAYTPDVWVAVTWVRKPTSHCWTQECMSYVNGSSILRELRQNCSESPALKSLKMAGPVWSIHGGDVVYLMMAEADLKDKNAWAITVNMRNGALEGSTSFPAEREFFFRLPYRPFALSKYLNMASAAVVWNQEREDSKYDPNNSMVLVEGLDPCVTVNQLKGIVAVFGELRYMKIHADEHYGLVQFVSRTCAEQAISALNGTQIGRQSVRLSWRPSNINKQPPRRRISDRKGVCYHPYAHSYGFHGYSDTAAIGNDAYTVGTLPNNGYNHATASHFITGGRTRSLQNQSRSHSSQQII